MLVADRLTKSYRRHADAVPVLQGLSLRVETGEFLSVVGASGSAWGSAPTGLNVLGVNADVLSSALPAGAATAANQEVTAARTSATSAQAVQGVTGGVPMPTNAANTDGSLTGIIQAGVGKASFTADAIAQNVRALADAVAKSKPSGIKGTFIKRVAISSTMGPGVRIDPSSLSVKG